MNEVELKKDNLDKIINDIRVGGLVVNSNTDGNYFCIHKCVGNGYGYFAFASIAVKDDVLLASVNECLKGDIHRKKLFEILYQYQKD